MKPSSERRCAQSYFRMISPGSRHHPHGFASSKVWAPILEEVSTVRGSGWVDDQHAIFAIDFESGALTHPLPRGGTDCVQERIRTFEAKPGGIKNAAD
jgi:hypothetical protein